VNTVANVSVTVFGLALSNKALGVFQLCGTFTAFNGGVVFGNFNLIEVTLLGLRASENAFRPV
jgi:hypothetical protein